MIKVWIAGSNGQIGHALNEVLDPLEIEVLNTDKDELDITDTEEVLNFGIVNRPDVIINCTGVTDTKLCEEEPELAYRVNALGKVITFAFNEKRCVERVGGTAL